MPALNSNERRMLLAIYRGRKHQPDAAMRGMKDAKIVRRVGTSVSNFLLGKYELTGAGEGQINPGPEWIAR